MNPFQAQFPLSRKKFTKKMISRLPDSIIYSLLLGVAATMVNLFLAGKYPTLGELVAGVLSAAVVVFVVLMGIYAWYYKAYIRNYFYEGGENFITIKKGVFAPKEIHVQYQKVQDVYVDQDILDRIMGLYDVHIASATAASGMEAHIDGVDEEAANGLKEFFLRKIQGASAPAAPAAGGAMPADAPVVAQFKGEISNTTYPIQGSWLPMTILGLIFISLFYGLMFGGLIWVKSTKDGAAGFEFLPLFIGISVVSLILQSIYMIVWKGNYRFSFMPEYIQFHTGVLSMSERHLPYKSIQDVSVNQSLLERMFGLASVKIENAAQTTIKTRYGTQSINMGVVLVGQTPASAAAITEELKSVILSKSSSQMGL